MRCGRTVCQREGANYRHSMNGQLYCGRCARLINEANHASLCTLDAKVVELSTARETIHTIYVRRHYDSHALQCDYFCAFVDPNNVRFAAYDADRLTAVGKLVDVLSAFHERIRLADSIGIDSLPGEMGEPCRNKATPGCPPPPNRRRDAFGNYGSAYDLSKAHPFGLYRQPRPPCGGGAH